MKKHILFSFWVISLVWGQQLFVQGQTTFVDPVTYKPNVPTSPNVASLGKFGNIPMGYSSGLPNISIPIYEIKVGDFVLPITLKYHAGGIKVTEAASWVGLGWALDAGGTSSVEARGLKPDSYYQIPTGINKTSDIPCSVAYTIGTPVDKNDQKDAEPDIYHFNYAGKSLMVVQHPMGASDNQISYTIPDSPMGIPQLGKLGKDLPLGTITDEHGVNYHFKDKAKNDFQGGCSSGIPFFGGTSYTGYLSKISFNNRPEEIKFNYSLPISLYSDGGLMEQFLLYAEATSNGLPGAYKLPYNICNTMRYINEELYLNTIDFPGGYVKFVTSNRLDLMEGTGVWASSTNTAGKELDRIEVYNNQSVLPIKTVKFYYHYMNDTSPEISTRRLVLDSLQEYSPNETKPPYVFHYYPGNLPSRESKAQDHWGYYNGADGNISLVPKEAASILPTTSFTNIQITTSFFNDNTLTYSYKSTGPVNNSTREPNFSKTLIGTLKEIEYPTGGSTKFDYEPHSYLGGVDTSFVGKGSDILLTRSYSVGSTEYQHSSQGSKYTPVNSFRLVKDTPVNFIRTFICSVSGSRTCSTSNNDFFYKIESDKTNSTPYKFEFPTLSGCYFEGACTYPPEVLSKGLYHVYVYCSNCDYATIEVSYQGPKTIDTVYTPRVKTTGGLRIKRITDIVDRTSPDPTKDIVRTYNYIKDSPYIKGNTNTIVDTLPSGILLSGIPTYVYQTEIPYIEAPALLYAQLLYAVSNAVSPMVAYQGTPVAYPEVWEFTSPQFTNALGSNVRAGRSIYKYQFDSFPLTTIYGVTPNESGYFNEGTNGQLIKEYHYTRRNNKTNKPSLSVEYYTNSLSPYSLSSSKIYEYVLPYTSQIKKHRGISLEVYSKINGSLVNCGAHGFAYKARYYEHSAARSFMNKTTERVYDQDDTTQTKYVETITTYEEDDRTQQPTKTTVINSDGVEHSTEMKYSAQSPTFKPYWSFYDRNIYTALQEKVMKIKKPGDSKERIIGGQLVEYGVTASKWYNGTDSLNAIVPLSISSIKTKVPLNLNVIPLNSTNLSRFLLDSNYTKDERYTKHDLSGNVLDYQKEGDIPVAFVWGYDNQELIAQVANANSNQVAYTSFEKGTNGTAMDQGNFTTLTGTFYDGVNNTALPAPKTGNCSFKGTITKTSLPAGKYKVSFWVKGVSSSLTINGTASEMIMMTASTWLYFEKVLTIPANGTITITTPTGVYIDELRLQPEDSRMTTFTYNPLVGVTTVTDPNNISQYYTYDGLNRLKYVKDQDGNIVKRNYYFYKP